MQRVEKKELVATIRDALIGSVEDPTRVAYAIVDELTDLGFEVVKQED